MQPRQHVREIQVCHLYLYLPLFLIQFHVSIYWHDMLHNYKVDLSCCTLTRDLCKWVSLVLDLLVSLDSTLLLLRADYLNTWQCDIKTKDVLLRIFRMFTLVWVSSWIGSRNKSSSAPQQKHLLTIQQLHLLQLQHLLHQQPSQRLHLANQQKQSKVRVKEARFTGNRAWRTCIDSAHRAE